jgi:hypothetical protein
MPPDAIAAAKAAVSTVRMLEGPALLTFDDGGVSPSPHRGPERAAGETFLYHHGAYRHARVFDRSAVARTPPPRAHHRQPLQLASRPHGHVDPPPRTANGGRASTAFRVLGMA